MITLVLAALSVLFVAESSAQCPHVGVPLWSASGLSTSGTITVPQGTSVALDVALGSSANPTNEIVVLGKLVLLPGMAHEIHTSGIRLEGSGELWIGSEACPFTDDAQVVLYGSKPGGNPSGPTECGLKFVCARSGTRLEIHGAPQTRWARLASPVSAGSSTITLDTDITWPVGSSVVVATTDFHDPKKDQSELRVVTARTGRTLTLDAPLVFGHYAGNLLEGVNNNVDRFDIGAEVGLLTSNVKIRGDMSGSSSTQGFGGHLLVRDATVHVENVELRDLGQTGVLARYPAHFHLSGDMAGMYFRSNAVVDSHQRAFVIHGTNDALVENNVAYKVVGSAYFVENGNEVRNTIKGNLAVTILSSDRTGLNFDRDLVPAYWITHPFNHLIDNVAAGSQRGFWWAFPFVPQEGAQPVTQNTFEPLGTVRGNTAHSMRWECFYMDKTPDLGGSWYRPRDASMLTSQTRDDIRRYGDPVTAFFRDSTAYKCTTHGGWARGDSQVWSGFKLADNQFGFEFAGADMRLENALIIGHSPNLGNPTAAEGVRSRPYSSADNECIGYRFYHDVGPTAIRNAKFYNFYDDVTNGVVSKGAAISQELGTVAIYQGRSKFYGVELINVSSAFYIEDNQATHRNRGQENTNLLDTDGSLTGTCGAQVLATGSWMRDTSIAPCTLHNEWGPGYACPADYPAHRIIHVEDKSGQVFPAPNGYDRSKGILTQLFGGRASKDLLGEATSFTVYEDVNAGDYRKIYEMVMLQNADYFLQFGSDSSTPSLLEIYVEFAPVGEVVRLAMPYPPGTTFTIMAGQSQGGGIALVQAPSRAELDVHSYFFDNAAGVLYLHVGAAWDDFAWLPHTNPFGAFVFNNVQSPETSLNARKYFVQASCGSCQHTVQPSSLTGSLENVAPLIPRCGEDLSSGRPVWATAGTSDLVVFDVANGGFAADWSSNGLSSVVAEGVQLALPRSYDKGGIQRSSCMPKGSYTHLHMRIKEVNAGARPMNLLISLGNNAFGTHPYDGFNVEINNPHWIDAPFPKPIDGEFTDVYVDLSVLRLDLMNEICSFELRNKEQRPRTAVISYIAFVHRTVSIVPRSGPLPCWSTLGCFDRSAVATTGVPTTAPTTAVPSAAPTTYRPTVLGETPVPTTVRPTESPAQSAGASLLAVPLALLATALVAFFN